MGFDLRDDRGLIFGFRLELQGRAVEIDLAAINPHEPPPSPLWLHFNVNDTRARDWIANCAWLGPFGREQLLSTERTVHLETIGVGITGMLADVFADGPESFGLFQLYADPTCLVTGRHHAMTAIGLLRRDLGNGLAIDGTANLFNRLIEHLAATFGKMTADYAVFIDDAEDRVLAGHFPEANLGQRRRAMARLRRQVVADRHALGDLPLHPPAWWGKPAARDLRQVAGVLSAVAQDLELVQERARLLDEEIDSRIAERTNRNFYFLSVAAAVFLPITLISGIFGMNVGGLPWVENSSGFAWVMGCMLAAIVIALALMRWRRML